MKYLLTSAGVTNKSIANALQGLLGKSFGESSIIFIITASNTEGGDKRWLINNLNDIEKLNFKSIDILDIAAVTKEEWQSRFLANDIICVGGGNEMYVADVFEKYNMKEFLLSLSEDKVYIGISAGSMVLGKLMPAHLYPKVFPEEDFTRENSRGMNIFDFIFIPHLNSEFFKSIRNDNLNEIKEEFRCNTYALDDDSALVIDGNKIDLISEGKTREYKI